MACSFEMLVDVQGVEPEEQCLGTRQRSVGAESTALTKRDQPRRPRR